VAGKHEGGGYSGVIGCGYFLVRSIGNWRRRCPRER
jgi:hypothetical protein